MISYSVYHIHVDYSLNSGYIGITKNPELRFAQHRWKRKSSNQHLKNALKKYKDVVKFTILAKGLDQEAAELLEEMLRPYPNMGWNIAKGGNMPPNPKGKQRSEQYRTNISKAKLGSKNPMYGKKITFSEEHRKKISEAKTGKLSPLKNRPRKTVQCPHCLKIGGTGAMQQWHFDRCKDASK